MPSKRDLLRQQGYKKLEKRKKKKLEQLKGELLEEEDPVPGKRQGGTMDMIIGLIYIVLGTFGAVIAFVFNQFIIGIAFAVIMNIFGWKRMAK